MTTTNTVAAKITRRARALNLPLVAFKPARSDRDADPRYLLCKLDGTAFASFETLRDGLAELERLNDTYGDSLRAERDGTWRVWTRVCYRPMAERVAERCRGEGMRTRVVQIPEGFAIEVSGVYEPIKSTGHVAFAHGREFFHGPDGTLYIAPVNCPIGLDGYRQGASFECAPRADGHEQYLGHCHPCANRKREEPAWVCNHEAS